MRTFSHLTLSIEWSNPQTGQRLHLMTQIPSWVISLVIAGTTGSGDIAKDWLIKLIGT